MLAKGGRKECFTCSKTKAVSQFGKDSYRPDGLKFCCKVCEKAYRELRKKEKAVA